MLLLCSRRALRSALASAQTPLALAGHRMSCSSRPQELAVCFSVAVSLMVYTVYSVNCTVVRVLYFISTVCTVYLKTARKGELSSSFCLLLSCTVQCCSLVTFEHCS